MERQVLVDKEASGYDVPLSVPSSLNVKVSVPYISYIAFDSQSSS